MRRMCAGIADRFGVEILQEQNGVRRYAAVAIEAAA
jgi:hypothetical protein